MMSKTAILCVVAVAVLGAQAEFMQTRFTPEVAGMAPNPPDLPTSGGYHAVSTTMKCGINLTIQYMIIYSALAVARTASDGLGWKYEQVPVTKILGQCTHTIAYCPMAACMFLAIRMRVIWLSQGAEWDPQPWVCVCMQYVTWSILATTLIVAVIPLFILLLSLYGGMIGVITGTFTYMPANGQWRP